MPNDEIDCVVVEAWRRLLKDYEAGEVVVLKEADMERHFTELCKSGLRKRFAKALVLNQDQQMGKRVDVRLGDGDDLTIIQLKFYRDEADWKETSTMKNTVQSDLNFAEGKDSVWVGIIDAIPTTHRPALPFDFEWERVDLDPFVFEKFYRYASAPSSSPRERLQRAVLVKGSRLGRGG